MKINSPQDQSTADVPRDGQMLKRRERIRQVRRESGKDETPLQVEPSKGEASVTIPISTWSEVIRLARLGQQSLQHEADKKKLATQSQGGDVRREADLISREQNGDITQGRILATIAALRRRQ